LPGRARLAALAMQRTRKLHEFESPDRKIPELHDGLEAGSGSPLNMPAVAEHICQACGKVTWSPVPTRTDTMPACPCGGRRQIVRIRHRLRNGDRRVTAPTSALKSDSWRSRWHSAEA